MTDTFEVRGDFSPADTLPETFQADYSNPTAAVAGVMDAPGADAADATVADAAAEAPAQPNGFALLGLAPQLVQAVTDLGYTEPTQVQNKTIPKALAHADLQAAGDAKPGRGQLIDLMVSSQTGSGKTAAYLLPLLHTLLEQQAQAQAKEREDYERAVAEAAARGEPAPKRPRRKNPMDPRNFKAATPGALVLCPTRELAQQVAHDAIDLVRHCQGLRIANVVGGMPYQMQIARLQNADLVVATPGRLLDLQRSMQIKLDQVQFLVVDEADRMLDLGFADDLAEINQLTIARRQTMMFSATFAPRIQQLAARVMREPQRITIDSPQEKHANIRQSLHWADNAQHKRKLLDHWLRDASIDQAIVFASTQVECDGLANDLQQDGFSAVALHGALNQGLRNRRLMALRNGQVQILVATDVAARGIDVPTITHVFNYGLPMKAEDYTHRIGRTGRAGRDGLAVTFAEMRDRRRVMEIEQFTRQQFKAEVIAGLEPQQRFLDTRMPRDGKFGGPGRGNGGGKRGPARGREGGFDRGFSGGFDGARSARGQGGGFGQDAGNSPWEGGRDAGRDFNRDGHRNGPRHGAQDGFAPRAPHAQPRAPHHGHGGGKQRAPGREGFAGFGGNNERFAGNDRFAPRNPAAARPAPVGKPFVPRGVAGKRPAKPAR